MKITVLVDNYTYIDQYYFGEPALSYYIECDNKKILFDVGYSDAFIKNANKMNIHLNEIDTIVCSHGHNDHILGLKYLCETIHTLDKKLIAHPLCFNPKYVENEYIGTPYTVEELKTRFQLNLTKEVLNITNSLIWLGEIPRINDFENKYPIGITQNNHKDEEDYLFDDSALVYQSDKGIFIITACSHSGICNIIEYAKQVCNDERVLGVIGGFHLFELDHQTSQTISYLEKEKIPNLYPCHCVSLKVKAEMMKTLHVHEVGVGLTLDI